MHQPDKTVARIRIKIPVQRIKDLLCNALEGGSNYWYWIEEMHYPEGKTRADVEFPHLDVPFLPGGWLLIQDDEGDMPTTKLDYQAMIRGLTVMARDEARHFGDFIAENDDATTGDVFLQCALWGKVIYG